MCVGPAGGPPSADDLFGSFCIKAKRTEIYLAEPVPILSGGSISNKKIFSMGGGPGGNKF